MKLKFLAALFLSGCCLWGSAQSKPMNPITKAMMDVYDQQLTENPKDYDVYFRRASEYYNHDQYLRALSDIDNAIKYTPASDKDMLFKSYSLRGNIYSMTGRHKEALEDFKKALDLDPKSFVIVYEMANEEYELGDLQAAKADYKKLQRLNPRSPEAVVGLTRVALKEGNVEQAKDLMDQIVALDPTSGASYIRRATIKKEMGDNEGAVEDIVVAISIQGNSRAVKELFAMADIDYPATMNGLNKAIDQAPSVALYYYLRASIAMAHYRYQAALADFKYILDQDLYNFPGLYDAMAQCYLALGKYPEALKECNFAIGMADDNAPYYITLAKIHRAMGHADLALKAATEAVELKPHDVDGKIEQALCYVSNKQYKEAAEVLGELTLNDDSDAYTMMLRAWILNDYLNQPKAAEGIYGTIVDLDYPEDDVTSYKGFAQLFQGNGPLGNRWMEQILKQPDSDGHLNYLGACYYAQAGDFDKAFKCMATSLANGYANAYDWNLNNDARVNVAPLRDRAEFKSLMSQYAELFK